MGLRIVGVNYALFLYLVATTLTMLQSGKTWTDGFLNVTDLQVSQVDLGRTTATQAYLDF